MKKIVLFLFSFVLLTSSVYGFSGGTITTDGDYVIHTFTSNGTFEATSAYEAEIFIVGGGGGGGGYAGGGGGAGQVYFDETYSLSVQNYTVVVGEGGVHATSGPTSATVGEPSSLGAVTANGGGGGSAGGGEAGTECSSGGSGGAGASTTADLEGCQATAGEGYGGGNATAQAGGYASAGGGGSGGVGENTPSNKDAGDGGDGTFNDISGTNLCYAGGGGGGVNNLAGYTQGYGTCHGGNGSIHSYTTGNYHSGGSNAVANTGSGGGGGLASGTAGLGTGFDGGSGIVIVRYLNASVPPYATVSVKDIYDNESLEGFTVYVGTDSNVTDVDGEATVYSPTGYNYTVDGGSEYFNVSGTATENQTVTAYIYGAFVTLEAYNVFGIQVNTFNVSVGNWSNQTTDGDTQLYLKPNANNTITFSAPDYIDLNATIETSGQDTGTYNTTGLYGTIYHINASDAWSGSTLTNFTISVTNSTLGGLLVEQSDSDSGWVNLTLVKNYEYFFEFNKTSYELLNVTLEANSTDQFYEFSSLPAPSIDITIRDSDNNSLITENVTITLTNNLTGTTNYTTTGGFFSGSLTPGNWTIELNSGSYAESEYQVTVSEGAVYYLTAYLQYAPYTVIKQYLDSASLAALPGATVTQEKVINGSWQVVSSRVTDVTGRTSFKYANDTNYRFTASLSGYQTKQYELDPVLFNKYSVKLDREQSLDFAPDYALVYIDYSPKLFYEDQETVMDFTFISPSGALSSYSYSVAYPGGSITGSGSNAAGESFSESFNISGADFDDRVYVNITYDTSVGSERAFRYDHGIVATPGNNTFIGNQDNTYGLGLLERALIGTAIVIAVAGITAFAAGSTGALLIGLFIMGFLIRIGFWEWWLGGISFLVGLALLAARSD